MIDPALRAILACPVDHQPLNEVQDALICPTCQRRYPIIDGIPTLLIEKAEVRADVEV